MDITDQYWEQQQAKQLKGKLKVLVFADTAYDPLLSKAAGLVF